MSRSQEVRDRVISSDSPLRHVSINQRSVNKTLAGEERVFGSKRRGPGNKTIHSPNKTGVEQDLPQEEIAIGDQGQILFVRDERIEPFELVIESNNRVTFRPVV